MRTPFITVFALGLLQPLAWTLLLPHSAFPQPHIGYAAIDPNLYWQTEPRVLTFALLVVPTVLMALFARDHVLASAQQPARLPLPQAVATLCTGIVAFRVISRTMPQLFEPDCMLAAIALAFYLLCYTAPYILVRTKAGASRTSSQAGRQEEPLRPKPRTRVDLQSALTDVGHAHLEHIGLTQRETLVLCADLRGLSATRAAEEIGVSPSTVREYRRRYRLKLQCRDIEGARSSLPAGSIAEQPLSPPIEPPAPNPSSHEVPAYRSRPVVSAFEFCCAIGCAMLFLLPFNHTVLSSMGFQTTALGVSPRDSLHTGFGAVSVRPSQPACPNARMSYATRLRCCCIAVLLPS